MKNKIISNILSLVMILNILLLTACNIIPLNTFTKLPDNKINRNTFTQKGIPDPLICGDSKKLGLSLSKNSIINKDGLVDNITTITTNLPLKDASVLPKFDDLKVPLSRYTPTILDYVIVIKDRTKTYEKIVPAGCTSFDWDGKDNNGVFFDIGFLTVDINFKITRNAVTSYYNFSSFSEKFLNLTIPSETNYSPTENRKVSSYMYCSCLTAPNNLALVLNTTKASTQSGLISLVNAPPLSIFNNRDVLLGQTNPSNPNAPVFNVPLATTLVNVSTAIGKLIAIDEPSCSFTPFLPENEINFNTEKTIQIKEEAIPPLDPATTKFFEVEDFKKLSDYANALQIDDSSANALYDQSKILESFLARKQSLIDRGSTDTAKMSEIDASIADINANISTLQGTVLGQLSTLYNSANVLANHVNSITEQQYITPYPIEEKSDSAYSYSQEAYGINQSIAPYLQNSISLHEPDKDNTNQTDVSLLSDISNDRKESLDPENIFISSKYIFNEIQTAKDLATDLISGNIITEEIPVALSSLKTLTTQIKFHIQFSKTINKDFYNQFSSKIGKIEDLNTIARTGVVSTLGLIIENIASYDNQSFRLKDVSNNDIKFLNGNTIENANQLDGFDTKYKKFLDDLNKLNSKLNNKKFTTKGLNLNDARNFVRDRITAFKDDIKTYEQIINSYKTSNLPNEEITLAVFLGIDEFQWTTVKKENPQLINDLLASYSEVIDLIISTAIDSVIPGADVNNILRRADTYYNQQPVSTSTQDKLSKNVAKSSVIKKNMFKLIKVLGKAVKVIDFIIKAFELIDNGATIVDFYQKTLPVKKAANKYCYSFDTAQTNVGTDKQKVRCLNELGEYLFHLGENTALQTRYPLYPINEIMNENPKNKETKVKGTNNAQELQNSVLNPSLFRQKLREILYKQTSDDLKEDIVLPNSPSDPNWAWQNIIYNNYILAYQRLVLNNGIKINKINLKNRTPVLYSPKMKDRDGQGLIINNGFTVRVIDTNGDTLLQGGNQGWDRPDFNKATKIFLLNTILPYVNTYNASNPVVPQKIPTINDLRNYLSKAFTWHHDEEFLDEMVLMPRFIHRRVTHWGAANILLKSQNNKKWRNQWKSVLIYN